MKLSSLIKAVTDKLATVVAAPLLILGLAMPVQAFPELDLDSDNTNDISSLLLEVDYDSATGALSAESFAINSSTLVYAAGGSATVYNMNFELDALLDPTANTATGSLSIYGDLNDPSGSGLLLSGSLNTFGTSLGNLDPLQFIWDVTGGSLASLFGSQMGTILSATGFAGDFFADFDSGVFPVARADTFSHSVPEPALLLLGLMGCGLVLVSRRRA